MLKLSTRPHKTWLVNSAVFEGGALEHRLSITIKTARGAGDHYALKLRHIKSTQIDRRRCQCIHIINAHIREHAPFQKIPANSGKLSGIFAANARCMIIIKPRCIVYTLRAHFANVMFICVRVCVRAHVQGCKYGRAHSKLAITAIQKFWCDRHVVDREIF